MKKILLAPNSYKECSYSTEAADRFEKILGKDSKLKITKFPISDGGDGFLQVCCRNFNLEVLTFEVTKPYNNELFVVKTGYSANDKSLYIESAEVIGLKLIPNEKRHPLLLNSKGLGMLFNLVIESGLNVDKIILGIGGTGTSDLGLGFCSAFGLRLYDIFENEVEIIPANYVLASKISWPRFRLPFSIELVTDVDNELLGPNGAAITFAKQKGATDREIDVMELGFTKMLKLFKDNGLVESSAGLSGAGGGLAAGLQIFFNVMKIIMAKDFITGMLSGKIDEVAPDFILTGEGAFDGQSLMNKGAKVVIDNCISRDIPVFLVCGKIDKNSISSYGDKVFPIELQSFFKNQQESINNFQKGIELAGEKVIDYIFNR